MTRNEMINRYNTLAVATAYIVGFILDGMLYYTMSAHIADEFLKFDHMASARGGWAKIRVRLSSADRKALVEKLKSDYEEAYGREDNDPWDRYSAAVGMAENASDDTTVEFVFKRADKAMYEDKSVFKKNFGGYRQTATS